MTATDTQAGALALVAEATARLRAAEDAQRAMVLAALAVGVPLAQVAKAAQVSRQTIYTWKAAGA